MKKLLSLLVLLVALFVVAGCDNTNLKDNEIVIPEDLTTDPISITFWHAMGQANALIIEELIADFNEIYPNITVTQASQGGYTDLRDKITKAITAGTEPTLAQAYPDHVAVYLQGNAVLPLDEYMANEKWGFTQADLDDFVPSFLAEGTIYDEAGTYYSLPFNKSTEVMFYNKTYFDAKGLTVPTTWAELRTVAEFIKADTGKVAFAYDSEANLFITLTEQWGGAYTSVAGEILFNNAQSKAAVTFFHQMYVERLAATPTHFDGQNYASDIFKAENIYLTVGSSAGARYNDSTIFEVGVAPIPQFSGAGAKPAVIQQGTNVSIFKNATDNQRLAAWLFLKFITSTEATTIFSTGTAYFPVRESAYNSPAYQAFLANTGDILARSAVVAKLQSSIFFTSPAFPGSSLARDEVQALIRAVLYGNKSINQAYTDALNELVW
jgi:multiple sugar transport system substrate-binding protein